jgi:hypothetical protein
LGRRAFTTTFEEHVSVVLPSGSVGYLVSTFVAPRTVVPAVAAVPDPRTARLLAKISLRHRIR